MFVATVNGEREYLEETLSTCRFAQRCGMLSHDVVLNEEVDPALGIARLKQENAYLKAALKGDSGALTALADKVKPPSAGAGSGSGKKYATTKNSK